MSDNPEMSVLARTSSIKTPNYTLLIPVQQRAAADIGITLSVDIKNDTPNPISAENRYSTVWMPGLSCRTAVFSFLTHLGA